MLTTRVIPCLDVRAGRVVKGVRFSGLRDMGDPAELARAYEEQGADEIVLLDVSATAEERRASLDTVERVRAVLSIALTVGGGVRGIDDARALLEAGADKVSVNTAAALRPDLLAEMAQRFGSQCTVIAIDAARIGPPAAGSDERLASWVITLRSGTERAPTDAFDWARRATALGAGEILLTSWDRDGTREGYDLDLVRTVSQAVAVPVIASGGADNAAHMAEASLAGAHAVLAASMFHEGRYTVGQVKRELIERGVEARL